MRSAAALGTGAATGAAVAVPRELRCFAQWVGWDYRPTKSGLTKVPHRLPGEDHCSAPGRPRPLVRTASTNDPSTWSRYELARPHPRIGFVFTREDPFCGIDLDDCLDPETGEMSLVARVTVRYLASYAEVSPSGRGVKVVARGAVPGERRQHRALGVEMYDAGRFFALTGDRLPGAPPHTAEVDLAPLHRWIFGPDETQQGNAGVPGADATRGPAGTVPSEEHVLHKARAAANGARFGRLWRGDASGYPSRSEADLALCAMLAYWSDGDPETMEALFWRSGLVRDKWRSRPDYRRRTIQRAIATCLR